MAASKRQVDAYRRRLAKITAAADASLLTAECINAVATVEPLHGDRVRQTGTLVSYTHRLEVGILGAYIATDVRLCPFCVDRHSEQCPAEHALPVIRDVVLYNIRRNGDGEQQP